MALLIGIVLLNATEADPPGTRVSTGASRSADKEKPDKGRGDNRRVAATTTVVTTIPPPRPPRDVKVIVVNASGVRGAAGKASDVLKAPGYNVLAPTNTRNSESSVFFAPGYESDAAAIAVLLGFPAASVKPLPTPPPIPDSKDANIVVLVGTDEGSRFAATGGASRSTTTRPSTTTTTSAGGGGPTTTSKP